MIHPGEHEAVKAGVHGLGGLFAAVCLAYNVAAWCERKKPHLARNAVFYAGLTIWECVKVVHHLEDR